jgi:hypothetical protein
MAEDALGVYVYCVLPGDAGVSLDDLGGVDPRHRVRAVGHAGISALVSGVSLAEFGAEPLKRNLNDLQWVEPVARAHQHVLDRALAAATVVPLRLCTVYNDEDGVRAMLEREHDVLASSLARLAGRQEWGIKLIVDPQLVRDTARRRAAESAAASPGESSGAGHAYVSRLRRDRVARDEAQRMTREAARTLHRGLAAHAAGAKILRNPPRELSGGDGETVFNGAYLVDRERATEFRAVATDLGEHHSPHGMRVEITGPWPPYSFVGERTDERRSSRAGVR